MILDESHKKQFNAAFPLQNHSRLIIYFLVDTHAHSHTWLRFVALAWIKLTDKKI